MEKRVYYKPNSADLDVIIEHIKKVIPCFITREYIEMDCSKVEIIARVEDIPTVQRLMDLAEEV
jgi:hypothetical protein